MLLYTMDFSWIIILITTILVGIIMLKRRKRERTENVPKPPSLPFIGHSFSVDLQNVHFTFAKYAEKYGKIFQVTIFGQTSVVQTTVNYSERPSVTKNIPKYSMIGLSTLQEITLHLVVALLYLDN